MTTETLHDILLRRTVFTFERDGHTDIKADHIEHPNGKPEEVNGFVLDISSKKYGIPYITEVETCDSLDLPDTEEQFRAFSRTNAKFIVVVPENCFDKVNQKIRNMSINANVYTG